MRLVGTNIHYVPSNEVQVPTEEATGKGLKRILPIVVSFIVPYAAPWLAAKVGLSSALSGAFGTVLGKTAAGIAGRAISSAIVGAGIGAATGTGAGAGALGGLFGSFSNAGRLGVGKSATAVAPAGTSSLSGPGSVLKTGVAPSPSTNLTPLSRGMTKPPATTTGPFRGADSATAKPVSPSGASGPMTTTAAPGTAISSSTGDYALTTSSPAPGVRPISFTPEAGGPATATLGQRAQTAVGQAGSRVMKTLTDPDTILRAGMFLATGAISGSPEEQAAIREQAEALRELRERDSQAFNTRMQLAQQAIGEANFYDPLAVANWAAAQAKTSASAAAQQAQRESMARGSRNTGRDEAIRRAGLLNVAARGSQAFAEGYERGVGARQSGIAAAAGMVPSAPTSEFEAFALLNRERAATAEEERRRAAGIGSLFAGLTEAPRWT